MVRTEFDPKTKVWKAPTSPYQFGNKTVGEVFFDKLDVNPNAPIEIRHDTGRIITRKEFKQMSANIAQSYLNLGVTPDDNVVFLLDNHDYSAALIIAATFIAAPFCALELQMDRLTTKNLLYTLHPKVIVCEEYELEKVKSIVAELDFKNCLVFVARPDGPNSVTELWKNKVDINKFKPVPVKDAEHKVAAIVPSSATTGTSKLINLSSPMIVQGYTPDFGPITTAFTFSGLNWYSGISILFHACFMENLKRVNTLQSFTPELLLEIIEKHKVNLLLTHPDYVNAILRSPKINTTDFSSLYIVIVTGIPLSPHMKAKFEKYLTNGGVVIMYGLTETAGAVTNSLLGLDKEGSSGVLLENKRAKIVNEDGEPVGPGEVGEICVLVDHKFLGYYNNPRLTAECLDKEGYLKTGDIGYFDEDGELYIKDRKKDMIPVGKHIVVASVLEAIVNQCPGVYECCVVDLPHPELGFVPVAAVIKAKGSTVTDEDIIDFVAARQPPELQLKGGVVFCDALPKTTSGKFKRYLIREVVKEKLPSFLNYLY